MTSTLCSGELQPGSVGAALPGIEIRLVDEAGRRARRARTRARSRSAAPTCSAATGPTAPAARTTDGWWATGDVGFLDASGDLFLVDRLKELVIVSGFNVYPVEVEDVIREVPAVADAAVIGVEDAAHRRGRRGLRRARPAPTPAAVARRRTRALRAAPGPLQAAVADRGGRRAAR